MGRDSGARVPLVCLFFVFAEILLEVGRFSSGYVRPDVNFCVAKLKAPSPKWLKEL